MLYYRLKHSLDTKIIGQVSSQLEKFLIKHWYYHIVNVKGNFIEREIKLPIIDEVIKVAYRAKLTDNLSYANDAFVINEKVLNLFQQFKITPHQYTKMQVTHKNKIYPYFYWYSYEIGYDLIDFEKSKFVAEGRYGLFENQKTIEAKVETVSDIVNWSRFNSRFPALIPVELALNDAIYNYDMFQLPLGIGGYFVNERMKEAILSANIKGFDFFGEYTNVITAYQY